MAAPPSMAPAKVDDLYAPTKAFYEHSGAHRVNTDAHIFNIIRTAHPHSQVTVIPEFTCPLHAYGQASSDITISPISPETSLSWLFYIPPSRRLDLSNGFLASETFYETFLLRYKQQEYLVYFVDGRDGTMPYGVTRNQYVVSPNNDSGLALSILHQLVRDIGAWVSSLHDEIWVFEQGFWRKDAELYANITKSRWSNVILHDDLKHDLINTVTRFFDSRSQYARLGVPWKRGLIFYGPPGNGKTISIKATMHTLYQRKLPVPTLYVKSLASFLGPEYSVSEIFARARAEAPCYLVFEDLDSMVTDDVRSFFLNAVDGLSLNEGVLMVGSTNHLDRLDPGIAKRPSRFDRKYLFDDPDRELRERYAGFWRGKVLGKKEWKVKEEEWEERGVGEGAGKSEEEPVEFPEVLCGKIAGITGGFSFAYMQEAFLATLLAIANRRQLRNGAGGDDAAMVESLGEQWEMLDLDEKAVQSDECDFVEVKKEKGGDDDHKDKLDKYELWREMKKQVENLRREMGKDKERE